jgi:hypothetical protein
MESLIILAPSLPFTMMTEIASGRMICKVLTEVPKIKYLTNTGLMTDGSTWPSHL